MVIELKDLESVHILDSTPFLGASAVGTAHGIKFSLINPLSNNSCTYLFNSSFSSNVIMCGALFGKPYPRLRSNS